MAEPNKPSRPTVIKMKLFPQDNDVVLYETGFEDDFLGRSSMSTQLSGLVERIEDPIVLALNDKWGAGKTFFLKRWVAAHRSENNGTATTVYFDAFESDYFSDPLVSLISALVARLPETQGVSVKKLKHAAAKLVKPLLGIAISAATFGAKQQVDEFGDALADAVSGEVNKASDALWKSEKERKEAMDEFRGLLSTIITATNAPIVIVVDELDRCRPDYALSVLEVIKHFFSVPKVHFILGINREALESSVNARYGASLNAEAYLRKFISASFSLPRILGKHEQDDVIVRYASNLIVDMKLPARIPKRCVDLLKIVAKTQDVSLRDVGKIFSRVALLPDVVYEKNWLEGWIDILCALLVTSVVNPSLHEKLVAGNASTLELRDFLGASRHKTDQDIDGEPNLRYDHDLTLWLSEIIFCCGVDELGDVSDLPELQDPVHKQFDNYGLVRDPKEIARSIQRDWVDLFRLV